MIEQPAMHGLVRDDFCRPVITRHLGKRIGEFPSKIFSEDKRSRMAQDGAGVGTPVRVDLAWTAASCLGGRCFLFCLVFDGVRRWSDGLCRPAGAKIVFNVWFYKYFAPLVLGGWASVGAGLDGRRHVQEDGLVFWFDLT